MATVINYIPLFETNLRYFKSLQIIGGKTIFDRYPSARQMLDEFDERYRYFLAYPVKDGDKVEFYGIKSKNNNLQILSEMQGDEANKYKDIKDITIAYFREKIEVYEATDKGRAEFLENAIRVIDDRFVYCYDDIVVLGAWGMQIRENVREDITVIRKNLLRPTPTVTIKFNSGDNGVLSGAGKISKKSGSIIDKGDIPYVDSKEGYEFVGWDNDPYGFQVKENIEFLAQYRQIVSSPPPLPLTSTFKVSFNGGYNGTLSGETIITKELNSFISEEDIPQVNPIEGYEFEGWDKEPYGCQVKEDMEFMAQYSEYMKIVPPPPLPSKLPWWRRFWLWLTALFAGKGCLKWLFRVLLFILLLFLLLLLLKNCNGCSSRHSTGAAFGGGDRSWIIDDPNVGRGGIYNPDEPYRPIPTPPEYNDILPPQQGVLPPIGDNPEIIPGNPTVIGNRLNILMEDEDKTIMDLARYFKEVYPDDQYKIVYYDDVVKRMQIEIPKEERDRLKEEIPIEFSPEYSLFVFDEALFEGQYTPNDPYFSDDSKNWYLKVIGAPQAWDITRGSDKITIAIVDNGFNLSHPELKGKVVLPYNVWLHSKKIFAQNVDHGTHVAGIALAEVDNNKGLCGIAPGCKFMPVQVADSRGLMTTTSVLDGILYALYQGADVINVSLGGQFEGLSGFPESEQQNLINNHFREEERLWRYIMRMAALHNSTIVVAAGNDNVLAGIEALQRPELFITVSAADKDNINYNKAEYSNYGEYSTISAPGTQIYSTIGSNSYQMMDGTSMAAPIISGAVALMKSLNDTITTKQIICILQGTGTPANGNIGNLIQLHKALDVVKNGEVIDCAPISIPAIGDVQILLSWDNYNDLDLICIAPNNEEVWYNNPRVPSGGQLQIDMNVEYPDSKSPIENIYWPQGGAPNGVYNVYLKYYKQHEKDIEATSYKIKVIFGDETEEYEGVITKGDNTLHICTFSLGNDVVQVNPSDSTDATDFSNKRDELLQRRNQLQDELERVERELRSIENRR